MRNKRKWGLVFRYILFTCVLNSPITVLYNERFPCWCGNAIQKLGQNIGHRTTRWLIALLSHALIDTIIQVHFTRGRFCVEDISFIYIGSFTAPDRADWKTTVRYRICRGCGRKYICLSSSASGSQCAFSSNSKDAITSSCPRTGRRDDHRLWLRLPFA